MEFLRRTLGLALITLLLFGIGYPAAMVVIGKLIAPHGAKGKPVYQNGKLVGFENVGQHFHSAHYFWSRPSAAAYDASAAGGSNLGPANPDFLKLVQSRIDTLLKYHPGLLVEDIPPDLVSASGSGLDPHISAEAARIQISRIAASRGLSEEKLLQLINRHTQEPLLGFLGPGGYVNVLKLNLALDELSKD